MAFSGKESYGTSSWFKARKREVLSHVRALDDFTNVHALATRLVENVGEEIDDTEQLRGALFMTAVVTYARQFVKSKNKYGETNVYQTKHLKRDARFDEKLHDHLLYVRNKLIAHDDGEQLPPTFHLLSMSLDQNASAGEKPLLGTARSYSLSSAKGPKFFVSLQRHSEGCVDTRSNRAIAAELGVSEGTVRNGKKSGAQPYAPDPDERPTIDNPPKGAPWDDQDDRDEEDQTVEKRVIGKDGKSYPATKPPVKKKNYP
jgi:hypothetical protein